MAALPWKAGSLIGLLALLIPYLVITAASFVAVVDDELEVGAGIFALIVSFAPGRLVTNLFISASDVSALRNVQPEDYPSVSNELAEAVGIFQSTPEALLLGLYVFAPLVFYLGGRFLARHYATGPGILEHVRAPVPLVAGALPFMLVIALAFPVLNPGGSVLVAGIGVPLVFGVLGALTVYAFGDAGWLASKAAGWTAAAVGVVMGALLLPLPPIPSNAGWEYQIDLAQRLLLGIESYLSAVSLEFAYGGAGVAIFLVAVLAILLAGFLRVHWSDDDLRTPLAGARRGASVVLGYLAVVATLGILLPIATIFVPVGVGDITDGFSIGVTLFGSPHPNLGTYAYYVLVGGTIVPLLFGGLGGAASVWYSQRQGAPAAGPQAPPGPQGGQPPRQPPQGGGQQPTTGPGQPPAKQSQDASGGPATGQARDAPGATDAEDR